MTPLARKFFGQSGLPVARRRVVDPHGLLGRTDDLHCFDVSAIHGPVEATLQAQSGPGLEKMMVPLFSETFLPSPRTWLEFEDRGIKVGLFLEMRDGWIELVRVLCSSGCFVAVDGGCLRCEMGGVLSTIDESKIPDGYPLDRNGMAATVASTGFLAMLLLDVINTPDLIHLRRRTLSSGMQRALGKATGHYPMLAWSEVTINHAAVSRPCTREGLTGRKCLHFVRAHRRVLGPEHSTTVAAHWRGDPSIGIKQTRYRVEG